LTLAQPGEIRHSGEIDGFRVARPILPLLDTPAPIDEDFPPIPDPAPEPVDLDLSAPAHS
jgi:hypothetical protein